MSLESDLLLPSKGSWISGVLTFHRFSCRWVIWRATRHMNGVNEWNAWRWFMILDGIPTVLLHMTTFFVLANDPDSVPYLTERERA